MAVRVRQKNRDEEWNRNMGAARQQQDKDMLAMALKMNDQQAIGYLIGALGKKLWMDHLARRHAREDATNLQNGEIANGQISNVDAFRKANGYPSEPTLNVPQDWNKPTAEATLTREELIPIVEGGTGEYVGPKQPEINVPAEFTDTTNMVNGYLNFGPNNNYELQYLRQRGLF
jgi:hypothetical protein